MSGPVCVMNDKVNESETFHNKTTLFRVVNKINAYLHCVHFHSGNLVRLSILEMSYPGRFLLRIITSTRMRLLIMSLTLHVMCKAFLAILADVIVFTVAFLVLIYIPFIYRFIRTSFGRTLP